MSPSSEQAARPGLVVATLALAGTVAAIMQTLVTPLLPQLPQILHTSQSNATWVITVTLLAAAVFVPLSGRAGDLFGKRRVLLACTVPLIVGSVLCALASSVWPMIIGRGLQGIGMGMVPLGIALLRDVVPGEKMSSSIALVSASMGIGGGIGLPLSAAIAEYANWRVLFWLSAVLAVAIATLVWFVIPDVPPAAKGQHFDIVGAIGLGIGLICLLLGVSKGADWGWSSATTLGLLVAAVVVLIAWGAWELRSREPIVDLRTTARPRVLMTNITSIFVGIGMYASMLVLPQLLQYPAATGYGLGQSMLAAGLWMLPGGLMMMIVSPLGGKLTDARGPKVTLMCGALVLSLGYGLTQVLFGTAWGLMIALMVINGGVALAYGAMPALIMSSVPRTETAAANGFNTLMRSLGTSVGAAAIGAVLAQMTISMGEHTMTSEAGFRVALVIGGGVALVALLLASLIPAAPAPAEVEDDHTGHAPQAPAAGARASLDKATADA
ncbi:MFS transporter [Nocardia higoensis]|uniref:MFS transporter n=1 Tax=Nocardia higoensis TaxID=228599 RepID=UPI00031127E7|nr:MFS transporter [Nocardia higoensis]